jgi:magnesium chelatase subunit D
VAQADALASARHLRRAGLQALLIDTSPRPDPRASELAGALSASYIALPYVDAAALSIAVRSARGHG